MDVSPALATTVKVYATLLVAMLRSNVATAARVYLLLQAYDQVGRGRLETADVRVLLTSKDSTYRTCGWRRLRGILAKGEGIFWTRQVDKSKGIDLLWLHGPARIAKSLDCGRLLGTPVKMPVVALLSGLQATKAAFLASWHAGRPRKEGDKPISQATIREITGISEVTQRRYNKIAGVKVQHNIAITGLTWRENMARFEHSGNAFRFEDKQGKRGPRGRGLVAEHLPATYTSPYSQAPKGRQRKINRMIDLVLNATRGNNCKVAKRYHLEAKAALKAHCNRPDHGQYLRLKQPITPGGVQLWDAV